MQGTVSAEAQAAGEARADASGATAYLNLESGDCHGDDSAVHSLLQSRVSRVVIGELVHLPQGNRDVNGGVARHPCSDAQSSAHPSPSLSLLWLTLHQACGIRCLTCGAMRSGCCEPRACGWMCWVRLAAERM